MLHPPADRDPSARGELFKSPGEKKTAHSRGEYGEEAKEESMRARALHAPGHKSKVSFYLANFPRARAHTRTKSRGRERGLPRGGLYGDSICNNADELSRDAAMRAVLLLLLLLLPLMDRMTRCIWKFAGLEKLFLGYALIALNLYSVRISS